MSDAENTSKTRTNDDSDTPADTGILPSVGRKVWYYESADQTEPFDGTIVKVTAQAGEEVTSQTPCNIFVVEPGGFTRTATGIQASLDPVAKQHYCWMPYQLAQAGKKAPEAGEDAEASKSGGPDAPPAGAPGAKPSATGTAPGQAVKETVNKKPGN